MFKVFVMFGMYVTGILGSTSIRADKPLMDERLRFSTSMISDRYRQVCDCISPYRLLSGEVV